MSALFTTGTGGYYTYRLPALTRTPAGTLIAVCEGRVDSDADTGNIDLVCRRSPDGGTTWSAQYVALGHGSNTAAGPVLLTDPASGDVLLMSCYSRAQDTSELIRSGEAGPRRIYVQRSADDGVTWSATVEITAAVRPSWMRGYGTGPGAGVTLASGRLVVPCWHTRTPAGTDTGTEAKYYGAHGIYSDDGGVTWALGYVGSIADGYINENETTAAQLPDGRVYLSCRDQGGTAPGTRADTYSADGHALSGPFQPQATLAMPTVHGAVIALPDGRLLHSGPAHPSERAAMALWISDDQGVTWQVKHRVSGLPAAYSSMVLLDAEVGLLYETGADGPYGGIDFVRIPLSQL
jgi:sialidase-1